MTGKPKILVISRSPWHEPPRLRHQVTRLLRDCGAEIYYLQTLTINKKPDETGEDGIYCMHLYEPVHHQLRPFQWLRWLNSMFVKKGIRKALSGITPDCILNFNYDYGGLRNIFPGIPFFTVINDNFVAMAKPWMRRSIFQTLRFTCANSDKLITVSYPLHRILMEFNNNTELLLPWSEKPYLEPVKNLKRDVVLYYGYISRLNEDIIDGLVSRNIRLRFIGPVEGNGFKIRQKHGDKPNVEFLPPMNIDSINTDDVCCSIAPYDINIEAINSTTASNRLFRLLAHGIPLAFPEMEHLIKAPDTIIKKCADLDAYFNAIFFFRDNFDQIQGDIRGFMEHHTAASRKKQLWDYIIQPNPSDAKYEL